MSHSNFKRKRLEEKRSSLEADWDLINNKLGKLRQSLIIQSGTAVRFQLEEEIKIEEARLAKVENELEALEKEPNIEKQISEIYQQLTTARQINDLQICLYRVEELLEQYPSKPQLKDLQQKIQRAIRCEIVPISSNELQRFASVKTKLFQPINRYRFLIFTFTSLIVTISIIFVRSLGLIQRIEMPIFDFLMRQRQPHEQADDRLLIVTVP